jgi:hypothetical protein
MKNFTAFALLLTAIALKPSPALSADELRSPIPPSAVWVMHSNGNAIGHGVLIQSDQNYFLSATHVIQAACREQKNFLISSTQNKDLILKLACPNTLSQNENDLFVSHIDGIDPLTDSKISIRPSFSSQLGSSLQAQAHCSWVMDGAIQNQTATYVNGYFYTSVQSRPGCSGSGLFDKESRLIGILKGFHLASRIPMYIPVSQELLNKNKEKIIHLHAVQSSNVINAGRGDPIDGGDYLLADFILAFPEEINSSKTFFLGLLHSNFILHAPAPLEAPIIPSQLSCLVNQKNSLISSQIQTSQNEEHYSFQFDLTPPQNWPFNFLDKISNHQVGTQTRIERLENGRLSNRSGLSNSLGDPIEIHFHGPDTSLTIQKRSWRIQLKPGQLFIEDFRLGKKKFKFQDHNLCYRGLLLTNPKTGDVVVFNISFDLSARDDGQGAYAGIRVTRAHANSLAELRQGKLQSLVVDYVLKGGAQP